VNADPEVHAWRAEALAHGPSGGIVAARLELPEYWAWGRVEVHGTNGTVAWSNPLDLPEPAAVAGPAASSA
jgi:hypothetical protein